MKAILREVSLLLDQFQLSEWRDMHLRTKRYALFIAKANGGPNPLLAAAPDGSLDDHRAGRNTAAIDPSEQPTTEQPTTMPVRTAVRAAEIAPATTVVAPHLGTLRSIMTAGSDVRMGTVVAQLEVLGAIEGVVSRTSGVVQEVLVPAGALVEYETPLLRIG